MVVLSAGPERVGSTIREALAKGADRAIQVVCDDLGARDALGVAKLLAAAVKPENPDLVLTGLQSEDLGLGQTGVIVAELLGLPHATLILHVEKTDAGLTVKRELEEGWFQQIELPLPALADHAVGRKQASLRHSDGHQAREDQRAQVLAATDLGRGRPRRWSSLEQITLPKKQKSTQILGGSAKEAAAALVEKLKMEARVL